VIYEFAKVLQQHLAVRKFPVHVEGLAERAPPDKRRGQLIVVERDYEGQDKVVPPNGGSSNPQKIAVILLAAKATLYIRSSLPNAHEGDHQRETEKFRDAFLCAYYKAVAGGRLTAAGNLPVISAGYAPRGKTPELEKQPGCIYELKFYVPRAVCDWEYNGEQAVGLPRPTGTATDVTTGGPVHVLKPDGGYDIAP